MNQPKPVPAPMPARPPAPAKARRWVYLAVAVLAVGVLAWAAWAMWPGDGLDAARSALDRRDFAAAYQLVSARLAERPDDAPAQLLAARASRRGGDLPRATDHLRRYRDLRGSDAVYELESALIRAKSGDTGEADRLFAAHIERPNDDQTPLVFEAYIEGWLATTARTGSPPSADRVAKLRRAADLWLTRRTGLEDQVQGRLWLARVCEADKDPAGSVAALREAVALDPNHIAARYQLSQLLAQERPDETREHLEYLRNKLPDDHRVCYGLAATYRVLGRYADARRLLVGLLDGPIRLSASVELASLDLDEGKVPDAEGRLRQVLAVAPNAPEANLEMSRCQRLAGRPDEADKFRKKYEELEAARTKK